MSRIELDHRALGFCALFLCLPVGAPALSIDLEDVDTLLVQLPCRHDCAALEEFESGTVRGI